MDLGFLVSMAIKCSSWVSVNRGTSRREDWFPEGNMLLASVKDANMMISRSVPYLESLNLIDLYRSYLKCTRFLHA